MKRQVSNKLLDILENWLSDCYACVKWDNTWSYMFTIKFGVRQGSVLSPVLFAIHVYDVAKCFKYDCHLLIILYANEILLLALVTTDNVISTDNVITNRYCNTLITVSVIALSPIM